MKYLYPAKLENDDGHLLVTFPDVPECFTEGDGLTETLELASDALCMMLCEREDKGETLPKATDAALLTAEPGETLVLVRADTTEYRKRTNTKAVKKTLTIPAWLNDAAEKHGVNYSQLLQEALVKHLRME